MTFESSMVSSHNTRGKKREKENYVNMILQLKAVVGIYWELQLYFAFVMLNFCVRCFK